MIGLDTNALLRLLTQDDAAQATLDATPESVMLNNTVLVETIWTLRRLYNFERSELQNLLEQLLTSSTFCFENREVVTQASALFQSSKADFSDCLIVAQNMALGCETTVTFDKAISSLPGVELLQVER